MEQVPLPLRRQFKLPCTATDYAVAQRNAEALVANIESMVGEVSKARIARTTDLVTKPTSKIGLLSELEGYGLLRYFTLGEAYLLNHEEVFEAIKAVDEAKGLEAKSEAEARACEMQRTVLCNQIFDFPVMVHIWEQTQHFALKFSGVREPTREDLLAYISLIVPELQYALGITSSEEVEALKIKPRTWRKDVSKILTVAYLAHIAWGSCIS